MVERGEDHRKRTSGERWLWRLVRPVFGMRISHRRRNNRMKSLGRHSEGKARGRSLSNATFLWQRRSHRTSDDRGRLHLRRKERGRIPAR
jgi:hypothetical protein